ncbi:MAG: cation:proton antiporter [Chlamydiota bacterium]|nr:cation:proton antiporter [Chlamydiota bacterium]
MEDNFTVIEQMEEIPLIQAITIIFVLSIVVLLLCHKIRIPSIVGFLMTGVLCGPHGLALVNEVIEVQTLANVGIVLLLFTVGMEFSVKRILEYKRFLLIGGTLQFALTVLAGFGIASILNRPVGESVFFGFLLSLSSTAIVMRMFEERGESVSPQGKVVLSILIFQDILVVPLVLLTPVLAGSEVDFDAALYFTVAKGILILIGVYFSAVWIVPKLLFYIAKTRSRELFLLGVLTICFAVAWLASSVGVSLSLGAFLAGLIVSESEYSHEAIGDIIPFQDVFTSFFFVSMGMLLDIEFIIRSPLLVIFSAIAVVVLKSSIVGFVTLLLGMPIRTAVLTGLALGQVGEFSFVLLKEGIEAGIASDYHYQFFLGVSLISMAVTPWLINFSPRIASYISEMPLPPTLKFGLKPVLHNSESKLCDHVIIIGLGLSGTNLARASREAQIPYTILDMNPETVKQEKERGEPIHFGDATHEAVLKHANILKAKVVAIAINDPLAGLRIVKKVRKLNPTVYLVARTRFVEEVKLMYQAGADDVIPDEFGSSIEIFSRVLNKYDVDSDHIKEFVSDLRSENYEILRVLYREPTVFSNINKAYEEVKTESFKVGRRSPLVGKTLKNTGLRKDYGVTVLMIHRDDQIITNPEAEETLQAKDLVILMGDPQGLSDVVCLFRSSRINNLD